jgi:hypothetical protein
MSTRAYRTAQGKMIDVDKLQAINEETIAVGNMKVNARGDQLGAGGRVVQGRNQAMDQHYRLHSPTAIDPNSGRAMADNVPNLDPSGESFDPEEDYSVQPVAPQLRGSLADSIAKSTTIEQKPMDPNMYNTKPRGPQRI